MTIMDTINEYKEKIILIGFLVGALSVFDVLPETVDTFNLGENVVFIYAGIILACAYLFYKHYGQPVEKPRPRPNPPSQPLPPQQPQETKPPEDKPQENPDKIMDEFPQPPYIKK